MRKKARADVNIEHQLKLVLEALDRFGRCPLLPNSEVAKKGRHLRDAAKKFANAIRIASDYELIEKGKIGHEGPKSIWPYLAIAAQLGPGEFGDDVPLALRFGANTRAKPMRLRVGADARRPVDLMGAVMEIEKQADIAAKAYSKKGVALLRERRLKRDLENIWEGLSGRRATHSNASTFDAPRGAFEEFAKRALQTTAWGRREQVRIFKTITRPEDKRRRAPLGTQ